jgi:hypothetical protein
VLSQRDSMYRRFPFPALPCRALDFSVPSGTHGRLGQAGRFEEGIWMRVRPRDSILIATISRDWLVPISEVRVADFAVGVSPARKRPSKCKGQPRLTLAFETLGRIYSLHGRRSGLQRARGRRRTNVSGTAQPQRADRVGRLPGPISRLSRPALFATVTSAILIGTTSI